MDPDGLAGDRLTYRDVELSRYACGRAVVIGDAARSMSPQLGTGAQLAMEDAALLGSAVSQHDDLSRSSGLSAGKHSNGQEEPHPLRFENSSLPVVVRTRES